MLHDALIAIKAPFYSVQK